MSSLAFYALDTQSGSFVADVISGTGSIIEECTSTRYYPDDNNVWQSYGSGIVGKYYYNGEWYMPWHYAWTNSCQESYDLTDVNWSATSMTTALTQTGMRGDANGATLLTATGANATCIYSTVTAASAAHGSRWFLKRSVGTGTVEITMDNGSTWTDITTALDAASGWYEAVVDQTLANPQIGIRIVTSGDAVIVGNAELALDPTQASESPIAILTWNSPIFTNGATGSVETISPYVNIANHKNTSSLYYFETAIAADDAEHGLVDTYIISTNGTTREDGAICNMANGSLWSSQWKTNAPASGGSTNQVTRSVVGGTKYQIASWYDSTADTALFSVDGDVASLISNFGEFDVGSKLYLVQLQAGSAASTSLLLRNVRRYDIDDLADGTTLELNLINQAESYGQNIVRQSRWLDYESISANPWTNSPNTSTARDIVGVDGVANRGVTCSDDDAASFSRYIGQLSQPYSGTNAPVTARFFVKKDTNTTRFPEFLFQLSGGTGKSGYAQINTQTGSSVNKFTLADGVSSASYNDDYWELLIDFDDDGGNTTFNVYVYPSYANTLGGNGVATLTDSVGIGNVEVFPGLNIEDVQGQAPAYTPSVTVDVIEVSTATDALISGPSRGVTRGITRNVTEGWTWGS